MTTTRLPYITTPSEELEFLNSKRSWKTVLTNYTTTSTHQRCLARNSEWQGEWEVSYASLNHVAKNEKVPTAIVENTRSN